MTREDQFYSAIKRDSYIVLMARCANDAESVWVNGWSVKTLIMQRLNCKMDNCSKEPLPGLVVIRQYMIILPLRSNSYVNVKYKRQLL